MSTENKKKVVDSTTTGAWVVVKVGTDQYWMCPRTNQIMAQVGVGGTLWTPPLII